MTVRNSTKLLITIMSLDIIIILSHLILSRVDGPPGFREVHVFLLALLDVHGEANLQSWYSSAKLLVAGLLFAVIFSIDGRRVLLLLAALSIAMSADEGAQFHERLGQLFSIYLLSESRTVLGAHSAHDWPYTYGILGLVVISIVLVYVKSVLKNRIAFVFSVGIVVFLCGAIGFEVLAHYYSGVPSWQRGRFISFIVSGYPEELLENIGSSIMLWSAVLAFEESIDARLAGAARKILIIVALPLPLVAFGTMLAAGIMWRPPLPSSPQIAGEVRKWSGCQLPRRVGAMGKDCTAQFRKGGRPGYVTFGPYIQMAPGDYRIGISFSSPEPDSADIGTWDIVFGAGRQRIASGVLRGTRSQAVTIVESFAVGYDRKIQDLEIRTYASGAGDVRIYSIAVEKLK